MAKVESSLIRLISEGASPDSINLALGEPVYKKPEWFLNLINRNVINSFAYAPNAGLPETREALIKINEYPGNIENMCLLNGAEEGLFATLTGIKMEVYDSGKTQILSPSPYFLNYQTIAQIIGMDFKPYPIPPFCKGSLLESIREHITDETAVVMLNSPANPSGLMICDEEIHTIERYCDSKGVYLLFDEVYRFTGNAQCRVSHSWNTIGEHTILISSVSKSFGLPGLRLGWAYSHNPIIQQIVTAHQSIAAIISSISQQLVAKFIDYDYKQWLQDNLDITISNRIKITGELDHYGLEYVNSTGAIYVLLIIPAKILNKMTDVEFAFYLRDQCKVLTVPGSAFGDYSKGYLRLSIGGNADEYPEAIKRIADAIADLSA